MFSNRLFQSRDWNISKRHAIWFCKICKVDNWECFMKHHSMEVMKNMWTSSRDPTSRSLSHNRSYKRKKMICLMVKEGKYSPPLCVSFPSISITTCNCDFFFFSSFCSLGGNFEYCYNRSKPGFQHLLRTIQ